MYQCKVCGQEFMTKCGYVKHELAHTVKFHCEICGKQYRRKETLFKHKKSSHTTTLDRQFKCSTCAQTFLTPGELIGHNQSHSVQTGGQSQSAFNGAVEIRTLQPVGIDRYDLVKFLASVRPIIEKHLLAKVRERAIKWYIVAQVKLTREDRDGDVRTVEPYFRSVTYSLLGTDTFDSHDLNEALQKLVTGLEKYIHESSGWILQNVIKLDINTILYKPLGGSSYVELPKTLASSHTVLNIRNKDNKCFVWAVLAGIHQVDHNANIVENYLPYEHELNMKGIDYPVALCKINQFEKQNEGFSINVFGWESNEIYPLRITRKKGKKYHINLLYLKKGDISHYCVIRDLNGFLYRTKSNRNKMYFCPYCLNGFTREDLMMNHREFCAENGDQKIVLPQKGVNDILKFNDFKKKMKCPFVIYCDFETVNRNVATCQQDPAKSSTTVTKHLEVCSFGYKRVCTDSRYTKESFIFRGQDASRHFIECLLKEEEEIKEILSHIEPLKMSENDQIDFENATHCSICENLFEEEECNKVIDHDHVTGFYRGAACNACNLGFRICNLFR